MPAPDQKSTNLLRVLFAVYLVLLAWTILWKLAVPWVGAAALLPHPVKLVPFLASGDADASAPQEVVANLLLFVPFGVYLGLLARWRWWLAAALFVAVSLLFETTQHLLSVGTFDITDVIVNTSGGVAGLGLVALLRRRLSAVVITRILLVGTVLWVVAIAIYIASPIRYAQQPDVIFPSPTASP